MQNLKDTDAAISVLSINSVNLNGEIVLNDIMLLEVIQRYPFLFNDHILCNKDPDYTAWAWKQITKCVNRAYENMVPRTEFPESDLRKRWESLREMVIRLITQCDISHIPILLRPLIMKMSKRLEVQESIDLEPDYCTEAQKIVLENYDLVEALPSRQLKSLEAEMMELILNAELSAIGKSELTAAEEERADKEFEDFLRTIHLRELFVLPSKNASPSDDGTQEEQLGSELSNSTVDTIENERSTHIINARVSNVDYEIQLEESEGEEVLPDTRPPTHSNVPTENDIKQEPMLDFQADEIETAVSTPSYAFLESMGSETDLPQYRIPRGGRWVPLEDAKLYIRRCNVRVKRMHLEDYLPLSAIKRTYIKSEQF